MEYTCSQHYREGPDEEVKAALSCNTIESVQITLESRLAFESGRRRRDEAAIMRIHHQLAQLTLSNTEQAA